VEDCGLDVLLTAGPEPGVGVALLIMALLWLASIPLFRLLDRKVKACEALEEKRSQEIRSHAVAIGMGFHAEDESGIGLRPQIRELIPAACKLKATNIMSADMKGCRINAFDLWYHASDGSINDVSVVIVDTEFDFPILTISPEMATDRVGAVVGLTDIDFESEEFSRNYRVWSPDKKFAYEVVNPQTMQLMLRLLRWEIRLCKGTLIYHRGLLLDPEEVSSAIEFGRQFLGFIPDFVKQQFRAGGPQAQNLES
jgi:hypothetical protein